MPLLASIPTLVARRMQRAFGSLNHRAREAARTRREHLILRDLDAMNDDRLYDLGLSREAIRCGLEAAHHPMAAARACRVHPVGGLNSERWGDHLEPFQRERYLGW